MNNINNKVTAAKIDLSVDYLVETRDGQFGLIMAKKDFEMFISFLDRGFLVDHYHDDLIVKSPWKHDLDIMKIYGLPSLVSGYSSLFSPQSRDLLWERKERKKMTLEQIEEALGYEIELVKPDEDYYPTSFCLKCTGCTGCQECKDVGTYDECCCDHKDDCPKKGERK